MQRLFHNHGMRFLLASVSVGLFGAVYEHFSFGVWSIWMVYAFVPFLFGGLWLLVLSNSKSSPGDLFLGLLEPGLVMLTLGSILAGVVEIYGTENRLLAVLPAVGGIQILAAVLIRTVHAIRNRSRKNLQYNVPDCPMPRAGRLGE